MVQTIENHQPAAAFKTRYAAAMACCGCMAWRNAVVQIGRSTTVFRDRRVFDVAESVFEILESVFFASWAGNSIIFGALSIAITLRAVFR
jgi:hypothetical protein